MKMEPTSMLQNPHNPYPAMTREKQFVITYNKDIESHVPGLYSILLWSF